MKRKYFSILLPLLTSVLLLAGGLSTLADVSATGGSDHKINICHRTHSESHPWEAIRVDRAAFDGEGHNDHTLHGDFLYNGPVKSNGQPDDRDGVASQWCSEHAPQPSPSPSPEQSPSSSPLPSSSPSPEPSPSPCQNREDEDDWDDEDEDIDEDEYDDDEDCSSPSPSSPSPSPSPSPEDSPSPSPSPSPTSQSSPSPSPQSSPSPSPCVTCGSNNTNTNTNENNQSQTQENNQTVNITIENGQVLGAKTPTVQPETGVSVLGLTAIGGLAPLGFALTRFGRGRITKEKESIEKIAGGLVEERVSKRNFGRI